MNIHGGYLAVFVAAYEPDMGGEYAQFPSKDYTDNYRTDVLHYAISKDGKEYRALNNGKGVFYPEGLYQLGSPSLFRKNDGTYGLIASMNNSTHQVLLYDSEDLIFFTNQRIIDLGGQQDVVKNPCVSYKENLNAYEVYWEDGSGQAYINSTTDFAAFTKATITECREKTLCGKLPEYALVKETSVFELTEEEYIRIERKFGQIKSVAVEVPDKIVVNRREEAGLPKYAKVLYSDGSGSSMKVGWDTESLPVDEKGDFLPGIYTVNGRIVTTTKYNSPLALYRADPCVTYDKAKNCYYLTGSNLNENSADNGGAYQNIIIRKADTINGLTDAEEFVIWEDTEFADGSKVTGWYWAPELHYIYGKWRVIALGTVTDEISDKSWRECIFTCYGDDVTDKNNWKYDGYIHPTTDGKWVGAFDTTYFEYNGQSYYVSPRDCKIHITTVDPKDLLHPTGPFVEISRADRGYESNIGAGKKFGMKVNDSGAMGQNIEEASAVLIHGDKIFITYAGCTVDMHYCVCLLYADVNADLMNPDSWKKYDYPLLATQDLTETIIKADYESVDENSASGLKSGGVYKGTFGPGHNFFTVDESGNPVIIYHARDWDDSYVGATGDDKYGLVDPGRHAYARSVHFDVDGFPVFNMEPDDILNENLRELTVKVEVH